jgi:hypothetical protein
VHRNFHEDFSQPVAAPPPERSTGLVFAAVAALVAVVWYQTPVVWAPSAVVALLFALVSLFAPGLLKPLNILWFRLTMLLHRIVNPLVMLLMYAIAILPTGLIMRLMRDPLRSKRHPALPTYWVDKIEQPGKMENQF